MSFTVRNIPVVRLILCLVAVLALPLLLFRFSMGLGAATNLTDGYPWGLWIGVDVLSLIALAAGAFVMAGTIHLFGGRKFEPLGRAAILVGVLGYSVYAIGLMADLGRPWMIWRVITNWNRHSPMFEVAWCVMLYTFVLWMELAPVILEKAGLSKHKETWYRTAPWAVVSMLTVFTYAMTGSVVWAMAILVILLVWEISMRLGAMPRDAQVPILLIMAGVIFSTMHQSSLGSLMLIVPHKLHPLWYTPIIPVLFLMSAIVTAPAVIIFQAVMSERFLGKRPPPGTLTSLAKGMPFLLGAYFLLKVADLVGRGAGLHAFTLSLQSISWWLEITIGILVPMVLFMTGEIIRSRVGMAIAALFVVIGLVWNRLNYAVLGIIVLAWERVYYPSWIEIAITLSIISVAVLAFDWAVRNLNIYEHEPAS